jgi:hypothetical protein
MSKRDVFINCPFSDDYDDMFRAAVFTVVRAGFNPRCAREDDDGGEVRIEKIIRIISGCRYGIHDISKTELDPGSKLPRFNMPFELGLYLGAKKFGGPKHHSKKLMIVDRHPHRYQKFLSDIAGQDIQSHNGNVRTFVLRIATWLRHERPGDVVPGGQAIANLYNRFRIDLPAIAKTKTLAPDEITFKDLVAMAAQWIVDGSGGA